MAENDGWVDVPEEDAQWVDVPEDTVAPVAEKAPVAAKAPVQDQFKTKPPVSAISTPGETGLMDRLKDPSQWVDAGDRALTNFLEGSTMGVAGAVQPYVNAAVDEINPFTESATMPERIEANRKAWNAKLDPALTAAASVVPSIALGPASLASNAASNLMMNSREQDRVNKDLFDGDNAVDNTQATALMTLAPPALGEFGRTGGVTLNALKNTNFANWIKQSANSMAGRSVGLNKSVLNNLPLDAPQTIGQVLNDKKIPMWGDDAASLLPKLKEELSASGAEMGDVLRTADTATGGTGRDIRAQVAARRAAVEDAQLAKKNDLLFQAGKHDEMSKSHIGQIQDLMGETADDVNRTADGLGTEIEVEQKFRRKFAEEIKNRSGQAPDRVPEDVTGLAAVDPKKRIKAADVAADEAVPLDPREMTKELGFDAHSFVDRAEKELLPALSDPALSGLKVKTEKLLKLYRDRAEKGMSFSEGNKMKSVLASTIRKFQDAKADQKVKLDLQRMIDDALEEQLAPVVGTDRFKNYVKAKSDYGALKESTKADSGLIRKEAGNMPFGLMETAGGGAIGNLIGNLAGQGTLGAVLGAAAPMAVKRGRTHGPAAAAATLRGLSDLMQSGAAQGPIEDMAKTRAAVRGLGPERVQAFIEWLESKRKPEDE